MGNLILMEEEQVIGIVKKAIEDALKGRQNEQVYKNPPKLFTINQVAKMLGRSHATITKMVNTGVIRSTKSRMIPQYAIDEYFSG